MSTDQLAPPGNSLRPLSPAHRGHSRATRALVAGGPATRVIMLTTFDLDEYVYDALLAGANGFLLKDLPPEQPIQGIRAVCRASRCYHPRSPSG